MRSSHTVALFLALATAFTAVPLYAASPFDGSWKGEGQPTPACADKAELAFTIKGNEFTQFLLVGSRGQITTARGSVNEGGIATIEYGPRRFQGNLTFTGTKFEGKLDTICGLREFFGVRH